MSNPLVIFIQTPDMLGCTKCFADVILITVAKRRKNKYAFIQVCISSLNNYGKVIILALGYLNISCKAGYQGILQKFVDSMNNEGIRMPRIVVTNMEIELIEAKNICFPASMHLINQCAVHNQIKDILMMYKKRLDFDFNLVLSRTLDILKEITPHRFKVLELEIISLVSPLEPEVTLEIQNILKLKEVWSLAYIPKVWTMGLHAIERQQHIESFNRSNF